MSIEWIENHHEMLEKGYHCQKKKKKLWSALCRWKTLSCWRHVGSLKKCLVCCLGREKHPRKALEYKDSAQWLK